MIDLTIIIPHYNSAKLLGKLLGTIPVRDNIQVIVIDDNSTEDTTLLDRVIKEDGRCEFYQNHTGKNSAGTCRNIGLGHAEGKWVMFADADDYYLDGFYEAVSGYFESDADIIYFPPTSIYLETGKKSDRHYPFDEFIYQYTKHNSERNKNILNFRYCSPCSKMYRREIIAEHNIEFDSTTVHNDVIFCTKYALLISSVLASDKIIYCITESSGSLTKRTDEESFNTRVNIHIRRHKLLREKMSDREIKRLGIFSAEFLLTALKSFGIRKMIEISKLFKQNKIIRLNLNLYNIFIIIKRLAV